MFYSGKMVSDQLDAALTNAVCQAEILDGSLLVLGNLVADTTYAASGDIEYDLYSGAAFATGNKEVVLVDYAGISEGKIMDNNYKMGIKLYDLKVPAGVPTRVRRPHLHDKFWLSAANFEGTGLAAGKYGIPANGKYTHAVSATLPESGYAIKILKEEDLTVGMQLHGKKYLCEVVQL